MRSHTKMNRIPKFIPITCLRCQDRNQTLRNQKLWKQLSFSNNTATLVQQPKQIKDLLLYESKTSWRLTHQLLQVLLSHELVAGTVPKLLLNLTTPTHLPGNEKEPHLQGFPSYYSGLQQPYFPKKVSLPFPVSFSMELTNNSPNPYSPPYSQRLPNQV